MKGFTLLELLIALSIFAVIAALAYGGLSTVLQGDARLARQSEQLAQLQRAFLFLERDLQHFLPRPIRDEFGAVRPALQGTSSALEFSRAGWSNPLGQPRSQLQRVGYYLEQGALYRVYWRVLDRAQDSQPARVPLLEEVDGLAVRYLDAALAWHDEWPPQNLQNQGDKQSTVLKALEISLRLAEWGSLARLFPVVEAFAPAPAEEAPPPPSAPP